MTIIENLKFILDQIKEIQIHEEHHLSNIK